MPNVSHCKYLPSLQNLKGQTWKYFGISTLFYLRAICPLIKCRGTGNLELETSRPRTREATGWLNGRAREEPSASQYPKCSQFIYYITKDMNKWGKRNSNKKMIAAFYAALFWMRYAKCSWYKLMRMPSPTSTDPKCVTTLTGVICLAVHLILISIERVKLLPWNTLTDLTVFFYFSIPCIKEKYTLFEQPRKNCNLLSFKESSYSWKQLSVHVL